MDLICILLTTENSGYLFISELTTGTFLCVKYLLVSFAYSSVPLFVDPVLVPEMEIPGKHF